MNVVDEIVKKYTYNDVFSFKALDDDIVTLENEIETLETKLEDLKHRGRSGYRMMPTIEEMKNKLKTLKAVRRIAQEKAMGNSGTNDEDSKMADALRISARAAKEMERVLTAANGKSPKKQDYIQATVENEEDIQEGAPITAEFEKTEENEEKNNEKVIEVPQEKHNEHLYGTPMETVIFKEPFSAISVKRDEGLPDSVSVFKEDGRVMKETETFRLEENEDEEKDIQVPENETEKTDIPESIVSDKIYVRERLCYSIDLFSLSERIPTVYEDVRIDFEKKEIEVLFRDVRDYSIFIDLLRKWKNTRGFWKALKNRRNIFISVMVYSDDGGRRIYNYEFSGCRLKTIKDSPYTTQDDTTHFFGVTLKYKDFIITEER